MSFFNRGGGALPPVTGNDGFAIIEVGGSAIFREIKSEYVGPGFGIGAFNLSGVANPQEIGATVSDPAFTASYTDTPDSAEVIDDQGNPAQDVSGTPTAFSYTNDYTKTANNAVVQFTLSAIKGAESGNRSLSLVWEPKCYWGIGASDLSTESDIKGLASNGLQSSRAKTFTTSPGSNEYIYYAYPTSYGAATFHVEGWEGGFDLIADDISVTNNGVTQDYRLYRSTNDNLGTTEVVVS